MLNCKDDENKCDCLAIECPRVFNYSIALKEECWMKECFISEKALDQSILLKVTIGYALILLVGLFGNIMAIAVLSRHPRIKTHSSVYIINLAVADIITLSVGLPFELIMNWRQYPWPFPDVFCNLKALIAETTNYTSILTILLFSFERYIAVCHPFLFGNIKSLRKNVHKMVYFSWLVSLIFASPFGIYHKADYVLKDWPGTDDNTPVSYSFPSSFFSYIVFL
ncbi:unnamed protein product [Angiostrongylus costaricensis]|uniref:G_PROTEIN_RECEP_F1_2 domain-containing protein n=1 Tax=Angiostrongylus costaricensis TaxID=334426 RepID=A0A0R3PSM6_ANGCS|nr:unnamed protein product [Angiostrongylus costaricensis]